MFKLASSFKPRNWKRIAEKAAARADALESEKRAVEHRNDHLRTERVKMLKELDALKAENRNLASRCAKISACETSGANGTVRRMARIARGEDAAAPPVRVDAGPAPLGICTPSKRLDLLRKYRDGSLGLSSSFSWSRTKQGGAYWATLNGTLYADLSPEPKAIVDAWIAELEAKQ